MVTTALSVGELYDRISAAQGSVGGRTFGQNLLLVLFVIGALFLIIEAMALIAGFALAKSLTGSVHAAVYRHRARPAGRLHAQDRGQDRGPARRAGRIVQLDDREHRGSAAAGGGEEAARGGTAHRARDSDVAAAAGTADDAGLVGDGALRPGARSRRRLLRFPAARRPSGRRADRRRVGQRAPRRRSTWRS